MQRINWPKLRGIILAAIVAFLIAYVIDQYYILDRKFMFIRELLY
ncbi:MAG: hypothetical protein ACEQSA_03985 [Weeksellaceae bacterium]